MIRAQFCHFRNSVLSRIAQKEKYKIMLGSSQVKLQICFLVVKEIRNEPYGSLENI